ncbi:MAG: hypothetical protein OEY64_06080, partial [Nitrospinota bacterium]|nr:hypothetical protein [Nitrospinota bacterium]
MDKDEIIGEISEIITIQESVMHNAPKKLAEVYENTKNEIKIGLPASWGSEEGERFSLSEYEISQIQNYMKRSSFNSAWAHLNGEKEKSDKVAHSCVALISGLGLDTIKVASKYIESEQFWRRKMKEEGVLPNQKGSFLIFKIFLGLFAICLMAFYAWSLLNMQSCSNPVQSGKLSCNLASAIYLCLETVAFFIIFSLIVPPVVDAFTKNSLWKLPLMIFLSIPSGMLMAYFNYVPNLLLPLLVWNNYYGLKEMQERKFLLESGGFIISKPLFWLSS